MEDPCFGCEVATVGSPIFEFSHAQGYRVALSRGVLLAALLIFYGARGYGHARTASACRGSPHHGVEWFFLFGTTCDTAKKRIACSESSGYFSKTKPLDRVNLAKAAQFGRLKEISKQRKLGVGGFRREFLKVS